MQNIEPSLGSNGGEMIIATTILLVGLLAGIAAAQLRGLRLGGVIVVPLVAVYLLRSFGTFPVFVLSTIAAYVSVAYVKGRIPLYGRQLFVFSVVVGALVPVAVIELLSLGLADASLGTEIEFIGSVLPGIAAYNFHRLSPEDRTLDAVASLAVLLFLVVVGIGLTIFVGLTPLAGVLAPLLLGPQSDIAIAFGLVVQRPSLPVIASSRLTVGLLALGLVLGETMRARYGLRIGGLIVVPLIVLIGFRNSALLPVWVATTALVYLGTEAIHRWTLLYGRVLLGVGVILGLLCSISFATVAPVRHGLLPFFVGLLAGVTAYNLHVTPPAERRAAVLITVGTVVVITSVARLLVIPAPAGVLQRVTRGHLVGGAVLLAPAVWELARLERIRPRNVPDNVTRADAPEGGQ